MAKKKEKQPEPEQQEEAQQEEQEEQQQEEEEQKKEQKVSAHPADLEDVEDEASDSHVSLDLILDISMPVTVELGRSQMTVQELLRLGVGSVVELDKMAGEPADLYVRDVRFARGEVVVVDNNFGLRITEIIDRKRRIEELGQ